MIIIRCSSVLPETINHINMTVAVSKYLVRNDGADPGLQSSHAE